MSDLKPFVHGEEGTHSVCNARLAAEGGKSRCCYCRPHKGCDFDAPQSAEGEAAPTCFNCGRSFPEHYPDGRCYTGEYEAWLKEEKDAMRANGLLAEPQQPKTESYEDTKLMTIIKRHRSFNMGSLSDLGAYEAIAELIRTERVSELEALEQIYMVVETPGGPLNVITAAMLKQRIATLKGENQ